MQHVDEFVRVRSGRSADEIRGEIGAADGAKTLDEGGQEPRAFLGRGFVGAGWKLQSGTNAGCECDPRVPGAVAEVDVAFQGRDMGRRRRWGWNVKEGARAVAKRPAA